MRAEQRAVWLVAVLLAASRVSSFAVPARQLNHAPTVVTRNHIKSPPKHRVHHIPPTTRCFYRWLSIARQTSDEPEHESEEQAQENDDMDHDVIEPQERNIRKKVRQLANSFVVRPIVSTAPLPRAIASVLRDATVGAVDMAVDEVVSRRQANGANGASEGKGSQLSTEISSSIVDYDVTGLVDEAFAPVESSLNEMEEALQQARNSMAEAKEQATEAIEAIQVAAIAQATGAAKAVEAAEKVATQEIMADLYYDDDSADVDVTTMTYDDVGYHTSEMDPPFLDEEQCLVPGEAVVRVEKAPENSRRIFAGIDIFASVDDVWKILTDYAHLQDVVPNLVVNEVMESYNGMPFDQVTVNTNLSDEEQCDHLSKQMKGALLKQVGGARVAGIKFSARTTLEVREWPQGLPDFAHFQDKEWEGESRDQRARDSVRKPLRRYRFPRPFALSSLPTRDISMQNIENDDGEFRMYQGVWRMQPLPGCAPGEKEAMRLTYAVEVSPRAYLPVSLVEGRIVRDLCSNLAAIRDFVGEKVPA